MEIITGYLAPETRHQKKIVMKIKLVVLLLISFFSTRLSANVDPQFQQANEYYKNNQFDKAIESYQQLVKDGYSSEELFYNLGSSYFKKEQMGKAILYFEKALKIDNDDEDVLHNLKVANSFSQNDVSPLPTFFLVRWWKGLHQLVSSSIWGVLGLILFWLGMGGIIYWLMASERADKKKGFVGGICLLLASLLPFALAYSQMTWEKDSEMAIVQSNRIPLRSAPDEESTEIIKIYEGLKVELLDEIGEWSKVRLLNGEQGWLPMDSFEKI